MATKKNRARITQAQHALKLARAVRAWQKNSVKKRGPLKNVASKLGVTVAQLQRFLPNWRNRKRKAEERQKIQRAVQRRLTLPHPTRLTTRGPRRDSARAMSLELDVRYHSQRSIHRLRRPLQQKKAAIRSKKREFARQLSREYLASL